MDEMNKSSVYDSYKRTGKKDLIYKEDVLFRIDRRMSTVMDCTDDPAIKHELALLKAFLMATIADM